MVFEFEALFAPFAEAAVGRLGYIYPHCSFSIVGLSIVAEGTFVDPQLLRRDVRYQLYREKIYQEGLPARSLMYGALLS
jgi:hypothetical protein